ncbi:ABC transporter domain-containing protein [Rhizoctonia solani AG-1 IA]|uniref:ABC transporter domain-containing protein n=1 Tax=Thanatephorus cucumeris (strain AG1-IA) TaxID=983506 RepID=L8X030_THACA|nr:ABC transporter domain-containing protein [Rhizoctonia solani AG-1 IA]
MVNSASLPEDPTGVPTPILSEKHQDSNDGIQSTISNQESNVRPKSGGETNDTSQGATTSKPLFREEKRGIWTLYYPLIPKKWANPFPFIRLAHGWDKPRAQGALRDLWRFISEVFALGPLALTMHLSLWTVSSVLPSLKLKKLWPDAVGCIFASRLNERSLVASSVPQQLKSLDTGLPYTLHSGGSNVQKMVESHFENRIFAVQSRLELRTSEDPAFESKIDRAAEYPWEAWSSLSTIMELASTISEVIATVAVLKGELISADGVNVFGVWALCFPLLTEFNEYRGGKVFYAKITNSNWFKKEAFSQIGTWKHYKQEILSFGLVDYINSKYTQAVSGLGDLKTENPLYSWSSDGGWFGLGDFDRLLDALPLVLCAWNAVYGSARSSLAAMIRTQQTSSAACGVIWSLIRRGEELFKLFVNITALYEVLEMKPGIEDGDINYPDEEHAHNTGMAIEFNFGYPFTSEKILNDLSFKIEPGQLCVIVGENGCGKSTTINLLNRLYDCDSGEIYIDGRPIRDYKVSTLRAAENIMYQNYCYFPLTNILMGRPDSEDPDTEIENAAKLGGAYDFIQKFPLRFETNLGSVHSGYASTACGKDEKEMFKSMEETEKSVQLSGGQWQRLAVSQARVAILRQCLDPKAEAVNNEMSHKESSDQRLIPANHHNHGDRRAPACGGLHPILDRRAEVPSYVSHLRDSANNAPSTTFVCDFAFQDLSAIPVEDTSRHSWLSATPILRSGQSQSWWPGRHLRAAFSAPRLSHSYRVENHDTLVAMTFHM